MRLSDLSEGAERDLKVPWGASGELLIRYVPERITGNDTQALAESESPLNLATAIAKGLTWWDVQEPDENGDLVDVPPTVANLMRIGLRALGAIWNAMGEDSKPSGEASGSFGSG